MRRLYGCASVICALAVGLGPQRAWCEGANVYLYDMGSAASPLWAGFTRVTPETAYSAEAGYGWLTETAKLKAYQATSIDSLAIDSVDGVRDEAAFRVDVPDGEYAVWVLSGAMGNIWRLRYLRMPHELLLQGQVAAAVTPAEDELFGCARYDWRAGDDIWDQFIRPRFRWIRADARVEGGTLEIGFRPARDFPVNAVIVAGAAVAGRVEEEIARIDASRREAFYGFWSEKLPTPAPVEDTSLEEHQRGYVLAETHCSVDLTPWSRPSVADSRTTLELLAAPGQQEQASFAVYALRDLDEVSFTVSELSAPDGATMSPDALQLGLVQFGPWQSATQEYTLKECLVLPLRPTFIGENTGKRFWLTVRTPPDARAGVYSGAVRVSAANAPSAELALRVRIVPIHLDEPPFERFMYFGTMYYLAKAYLPAFDADRYWEAMRTEVRFMQDNEHCRAQCILPTGSGFKMEDGKIVDVDLSDTARLMGIIDEEHAGPRDNTMICQTGILNTLLGGHFSRPDNPGVEFIPTPEGRENFIRAIRLVDERAKQEGWPEVAFEMLGEFTNFGESGARMAVEVHEAFREAGVSNTLRGNGICDMAAIEKNLVLYPQPNWAMMKTDWFRTIKQNSKRVWAYNFARSRFAMGWFCFKHGITRASYESGVYANGQPGNQFDTETMFPMGLPTSMTSIEPTVWLKRLVQGAIDYKYLYTLDRLITEAQASGKPEAVKTARVAREWLDGKLGQLPEGVDYMVGDPRADHDVQGRFWPVRDLDRYRWQIAEYIMALQNALGKGEA